MKKPFSSSLVFRQRLAVVLAAAVVIAFLAPCAAYAASSSDPFSGLSDAAETNGANWVALMMAIAAMIVAGAIYFGSANAAKWVGRFIAGTLFGLLATMGPRGILDFLQGLFHFGGAR